MRRSHPSSRRFSVAPKLETRALSPSCEQKVSARRAAGGGEGPGWPCRKSFKTGFRKARMTRQPITEPFTLQSLKIQER